jgi:hypothetical protein
MTVRPGRIVLVTRGAGSFYIDMAPLVVYQART